MKRFLSKRGDAGGFGVKSEEKEKKTAGPATILSMRKAGGKNVSKEQKMISRGRCPVPPSLRRGDAAKKGLPIIRFKGGLALWIGTIRLAFFCVLEEGTCS